MRIKENQEQLITRKFKCERLSSSDKNNSLLMDIAVEISAPKKTSLHNKQVSSKNLLRNIQKNSWQKDLCGQEATYLIKYKNEIALIFSLQCGNLYKSKDLEKAIQNEQKQASLCDTGIELCRKIVNGENVNVSKMQLAEIGDKLGITNPDIFSLKQFKDHCTLQLSYNDTQNKDKNENKEFHYVLKTYPSVELVLFWKNPNFSATWNNLIKDYNFPDSNKYSMADILFWFFIYDKVVSIPNIVGCSYFHLFAADYSTDMKLVAHYNKLGFSNDVAFSTLKPRFDFSCIFMYQSLENLKKRKEAFLQDFNTDENEEEMV